MPIQTSRIEGKGRRPPRRDRESRRRRLRRQGKRAYIRSVYFLPSLCTLGNAVSGFTSMFIAFLACMKDWVNPSEAAWWEAHGFSFAAYMIFLAMVFDALDGRLARFARHTTDFGGQLDSLADVVSFGAAPAFLMLLMFRTQGPGDMPGFTHRIIFCIGVLYVSCAALRLARFNVSNEHGEQRHFSFLGLPSPGAAGAIAALVLMQQELANQSLSFSLHHHARLSSFFHLAASVCLALLPFVVLCTGLLMISEIRYPHMVNRYLRGKQSIRFLLSVLILALLLVIAHQYTVGVGCLVYAFWGAVSYAVLQLRKRWMPSRL